MLYSRRFYENHAAGSTFSAETVVPIIIERFSPSSVVDVGCGTGIWLKVFRDLGVEEIRGYDGVWVNPDALVVPRDCFVGVDLGSANVLAGRFDVALSLEVAEHLAADSADQYVAKLVGLSNVVVFSAAIPGQGGRGHVNEQWQSYWARKFAHHGYVALDLIRPRIWSIRGVAWWYKQNMFVYVNTAEPPVADLMPIDTVHPDCFTERVMRPSFRAVLQALPAALVRAVRSRLPSR